MREVVVARCVDQKLLGVVVLDVWMLGCLSCWVDDDDKMGVSWPGETEVYIDGPGRDGILIPRVLPW
jgi:hypothetical protein